LLRYDSTTSRWRLAAQPVPPLPASLFANLKIVNDAGAATTTTDITADMVSMSSALSDTFRVLSVNVAPSMLNADGPNGLDIGSFVNGTITWYFVYVIYNPTTATTAGMYSLASTCGGTTLPAGYTFCVRVGAVRTDGAGTARWMRSLQMGRHAQYVVTAATNTANLPIAISGASGSTTTPTWTSQSVANYVPSTASTIYLSMFAPTASQTAMVAPNANYGAASSTSNPAPCMTVNGTSDGHNFACSFLLETANIFYASNGAATGVAVIGYDDNL
jgi:hypothetical protein